MTDDSQGIQLTPQEIEGLLAALDDEYKSRATYLQVLEDFGDVRPFSNIVKAEQRHIDALVDRFEFYGLDIPADPWSEKAPRYASLHEACVAGIEAEIENAELYDRVLAETARDDLLTVYRNLQRASQDNHLPAFRRGAERGGSGGRGRGPGGGRGRGSDDDQGHGPDGGQGRGSSGGRGRVPGLGGVGRRGGGGRRGAGGDR